ncbi:MAG TPA: hypothetical protein P5277_01120 [Candidatus Paceibacterota bacterium]|nr:hypothetical protein [Candidatus Paceibacterota bacterium]
MKYKTYIQALAFEEIIRSAYETLHVECQGVLFGIQKENKDNLVWIVESAHPIQLVKRYNKKTEPLIGSERGLCSLITEKIGDFHLHPSQKNNPGRMALSKTDINGLKENSPGIEILLALKHVKTRKKLKEKPLLISGYLCEDNQTYNINMGVYHYDDFDKRIRRCEIIVSKKMRSLIN